MVSAPIKCYRIGVACSLWKGRRQRADFCRVHDCDARAEWPRARLCVRGWAGVQCVLCLVRVATNMVTERTPMPLRVYERVIVNAKKSPAPGPSPLLILGPAALMYF